MKLWYILGYYDIGILFCYGGEFLLAKVEISMCEMYAVITYQ